MNDTQSESIQPTVEPTQPTGIARRRLLRAGMAAAPVVLALSGRSAMACDVSRPKGLSPLAWASFEANGGCAASSLSVPVQNYALCGNPDSWNCHKNPGCIKHWPINDCVPFNKIKCRPTGHIIASQIPYCDPNRIDVDDTDGWKSGRTFYSVFGHSPIGGSSSDTCSSILINQPTSVNAYLCAAYLNARTNQNYSMSVKDVMDLSIGTIGHKKNCSAQEVIDYCKNTMS